MPTQQSKHFRIEKYQYPFCNYTKISSNLKLQRVINWGGPAIYILKDKKMTFFFIKKY